MSQDKIHQDLEEARRTFHQLVRDTTAEDLRRPSQGTRWTNRQLLFHMVFGYLIVRTLLPWSIPSAGSAGAVASSSSSTLPGGRST